MEVFVEVGLHTKRCSLEQRAVVPSRNFHRQVQVYLAVFFPCVNIIILHFTFVSPSKCINRMCAELGHPESVVRFGGWLSRRSWMLS
jgi:hypothetical protein